MKQTHESESQAHKSAQGKTMKEEGGIVLEEEAIKEAHEVGFTECGDSHLRTMRGFDTEAVQPGETQETSAASWLFHFQLCY